MKKNSTTNSTPSTSSKKSRKTPKDVVVEQPKVFVKYLKLITGDCLIATVEESKTNDEVLILHSPMKVLPIDYLDLLMKMTQRGDAMSKEDERPQIMLESWLPRSIVAQQVCEVFKTDIILIADVNSLFIRSYTETILRLATMEELNRRAALGNTDPFFAKASEASDEEELDELFRDRIEGFKKNFN